MHHSKEKKILKNFLNYTFSIIAVSLSLLLAFPVWASADYGKQTLIGADFSNTDLKGATFYLTNLQDADLSGSDLEGASFFDAKLKNTNLSNTNLKEATLDSAIIDGANLNNAYLEDAFAFNTLFKNVSIIGSDFTNVILGTRETDYLCSIAEGINTVSNKSTKDTLGCK